MSRLSLNPFIVVHKRVVLDECSLHFILKRQIKEMKSQDFFFFNCYFTSWKLVLLFPRVDFLQWTFPWHCSQYLSAPPHNTKPCPLAPIQILGWLQEEYAWWSTGILSQLQPCCNCLFFFFFFFFFFLFRATPEVYGSSQSRSWIRAVAASLHHSHNIGSKLCLQHKPQLMAMLYL